MRINTYLAKIVLVVGAAICVTLLLGFGSVNAATPTIQESPPDRPTTVTDATGAFHFEGLARGTHQLYLDPSTLPVDLQPPTNTPQTDLWLIPGQSQVSDVIGDGVRLSASYDPEGTSINGMVFVDQDRDGQQDAAEPGLAGVTVIDPTLHQYFVPFDANDLHLLFAEIYNTLATGGQCLDIGSISDGLESFISVTASSAGTIVYYDHWEDGYDADPMSPGPTTEVNIVDAGVTQTFNDIVIAPRDPIVFQYDGRDRISVFGEPASVIFAVHPSELTPLGGIPESGEVLAGAWEVPEVTDWGQSFVPAIGEDIQINTAPTPNDFEYVGLEIMAALPNTEIWVNGNNVATLGVGETHLIDGENNGEGNGGVDSRDVITATGPVQVQMLGAACANPHSARAYTLQPLEGWSREYWAPVPDFADDGVWCNIDDSNPGFPGNDRDTDIYVHNPHNFPITVTFDDGAISESITVPPTETFSILNALGTGEFSSTAGAHLFSDDTFWGVSVIDSISGDAYPLSSSSGRNDWGYSLIPVEKLSSQVVIGWSPGNGLDNPTGSTNGSLAFVSALTNTVVYVDLDDDGLPDAFDMNGDGDANDQAVYFDPDFDEPTSDRGVPLSMSEVLRVADPNDHDLTGAVIYTQNLNEKVAVAWGQDPCQALVGQPFLDLGYTALPYPIPSLAKSSDLAVDADDSGDVSPGDTLTYTIVVHNNGLGSILNGVLTDTLPSEYTDYVVGSLQTTEPPPTASVDYLAANWGYMPMSNTLGVDPNVRAFRVGWDNIGPGANITVSLRVRIQDDLPVGVTDIVNQAVFGASTTTTDQSVGQPILQIDKVDEPDPVRPGDIITYTIVATNTGTSSAVDNLLLESLPPYVRYITDTLDLTLPYTSLQVITRSVSHTSSFRETYADDFDDYDPDQDIFLSSGYAGSDGSLPWSTDWDEINEDDGPLAGDVQAPADIAGALGPAGYLFLTDTDDDPSGAERGLDLNEFEAPRLRFYVFGDTDDDDDTYTVFVNGIPELTETYAGAYTERIIDLSDYTPGGPVTLRFVGNAGMEADDVYRIESIKIFEASPLRSSRRVLTTTNTLISYTTQSNINPIFYDQDTNQMQVTDNIAIPAGATVQFSFQVQVATPLTNGLQLLNTAAITSSNVTTTPFPLEDTEDTTVLSSHALTITKTADTGTVFIGQQLTYDLFWEVGGDEPAPGLVITDTIPYPYVRFVDCEGGLNCNFIAPDTVVWQLGDHLPVASGILYESGYVTLTVQAIEYPPGGTFTNVAVLDDETDTDPDQDDETTNVLDAGLTLTKRRISDSPVAVGKNVTFTIAITNTGAVTITRLPLEDTYDPTYLQFQAALPEPDADEPGRLAWDDLTLGLPDNLFVPGQSTQVLVVFTALTTTQHLSPPVTVNTAVSAGAETPTDVLPPVEDEDDVEIEPVDPDAIELVYFRATPRGDDVLIEWSTLFEIDTYGFWLYRGMDGVLERAEAVTFVPAKGWHSLGAAYQYLDPDLPAGEYYYWLVEVENSGTETAYGPVTVSAGGDAADMPHKIYLPLLRN
jgi:uncharacterized repeat protein (TIGR01451 family)